MTDSISTVFVTLSDSKYLHKAYRTIKDLRFRGTWNGPIVLITIDCDADETILHTYTVQEYKSTHKNTDAHVERLRQHPIKPMDDNRHFGKLTQWDKLQVFKPFFKQWDRVVFLDAGLRVLNPVNPLFGLDWRGKLCAPDDTGPYDNGNRFRCQVDLNANPPVTKALVEEFSPTILDELYFMNCIFMFDSELITETTYDELLDYMEKYPIMMCNEMSLMNLYWTFKKRVWSPFPHKVEDKYLYQWSEKCYRERVHWSSFHFLKYPVTIHMNED